MALAAVVAAVDTSAERGTAAVAGTTAVVVNIGGVQQQSCVIDQCAPA